MKTTSLFAYIKYLSIIGIVVASYLLFEQITNSPFKPCNINYSINCDAIISGVLAKTLGIPTPLYGFIGYVAIFFAARHKNKNVVLGVATFGLLFCLWLAYREIFELHVICPLCLICQTVMILIFSLSVWIHKIGSSTP